MATGNRFFNFEPQQYVSQYVPHNYDLIQGVGEAKQKQYNKGVEDLANTQSLFKINTDPVNKDYRDKKLKEYNDQLTEMANKYYETGDKSHLNKLRQITNQFQNDPERLQLEANYSNWTQQQKDTRALAEKGLYDPNTYDTYKKYGTNYDPFKQGLKAFDYSGTNPIQDYTKHAKDLMAGIAKQGSESGWYDVDSEGNIIGKKSGWEKVAREDIKRVAESQLDNYSSKPEVNYLRDIIKSQNPDLPQNQVEAAARQELYNSLLGEGEKQIFSKVKNEKDFKYAPKYVGDKKELEKAYINSGSSEGATTTLSTNKALANVGLNNAFNEDGTYKYKFSNQPAGPGSITTVGGGAGVMTGEAAEQNASNTILIKLANGLGFNPTDPTLPNKVYKYLENTAKQTIQTPNLHPSIGTNLAKDIFGKNTDISNTKMYIQGQPESAEKMDDLKAAMSNATNVRGLDFFADKPGAITVNVTPKDEGKTSGVDTPVTVETKNLDLQKEMKPMWQISKAAKTYANTAEFDKEAFSSALSPESNEVQAVQSLLNTPGLPYQKVVGSYLEPLANGAYKMRFSLYGNSGDTPNLGYIDYTFDKDGNLTKNGGIRSLLSAQEQERDQIQSKGSLKKYGTKVDEKHSTEDLNEE